MIRRTILSLFLLVAAAAAQPTPLPMPMPNDPMGAIEAGRDQDGQIVYAAIGEFNGLRLPGKTKAPFSTCWVGFGGGEQLVQSFQIVKGPYHWEDCSPNRAMPPDTVWVGPDQDGTAMCIVRGEYMGYWVAGKYRAGAPSCLVPFGGRERECYRFQVLVNNR